MNQTHPHPPSTPDKQTSNAHYLQLALNRLRLLLKRRVLWLKSQWQHDPAAESGRRVISDPHVAWLLRNEDRSAEQKFYAEDAAAHELTVAAEATQQELAAYRRRLGPENALPLEVLAHLFGLSEFEQDILLLCLASELDPAFQALFAYVQDNVHRTYPTMHLAFALFGSPQVPPFSLQSAFNAEAPLRRYQLITIPSDAPDEGHPLSTQPLSLPERVLDYLRGSNYPDAGLKPYLTPVQGAFSTDGLAQVSRQVVQAVQAARSDGTFPVVNLIGLGDGGQREVAAAVAAALRINLFQLDLIHLSTGKVNLPALSALLEREALLLQCAYFIDWTRADDLPDPFRRVIQTLEQQTKVLLFIAHQDRLETASRLINVTLPRFTSQERAALWQQSLDGQAPHIDIPPLVQQFQFGPQGVRQTVTAARYRAVMRGETETLTQTDLWAACREQSQWQLDDLAQRIEPAYTWDDLVLPPDIEIQLREIAAQVMHRHRVYDAWGYERKLNRGRGISALFAGASGTGKTMAAEVLANGLNLPLYRIDLAGVVSKYVGETEKNLRRIFQAAEQSGTILFFDEADALFGKRTEVKDSHDRYANIEVNYLLQLMENYSGLAILATNRRQAIDRAFLRRLRFVVDFVFPNLDSRRRIWRRVFPPDVPQEGIDYNQLAKLEITGGNIHSIALNAAFLAAADGGLVKMAHIMAATRREYAKIDKLEPGISGWMSPGEAFE